MIGSDNAQTMPLARRRPTCPECADWMEWLWRCLCFTDDAPRVCMCEACGVWMCLDCQTTLDILEVPSS